MEPVNAFSGFSVDNLEKAKYFYGTTLGLRVEEEMMGLLTIHLPGGATVMAYPKPNHEPASFTILNFVVKDIDAAVDDLTSQGVIFERYEGFRQDEKAISRSEDPEQGPDIAWFKDPAGNILAILED